MPAARVFARCAACAHGAVVRAGAPCLACGGEMQEAQPPAELFDGWRCFCYHCASTPC